MLVFKVGWCQQLHALMMVLSMVFKVIMNPWNKINLKLGREVSRFVSKVVDCSSNSHSNNNSNVVGSNSSFSNNSSNVVGLISSRASHPGLDSPDLDPQRGLGLRVGKYLRRLPMKPRDIRGGSWGVRRTEEGIEIC